MKSNIIAEKSFEFAVSMIKLARLLQNEGEYIISKQIYRSGTSIGANVEEAIAAQSRRDFGSKLSIACKEARERMYWLKLLEKSEITKVNLIEPQEKLSHIMNILHRILKTLNRDPKIQSTLKPNL